MQQVNIIPFMACYPISHMGHYKDLGTKLLSKNGPKLVGISDNNSVFTYKERIEIITRQWSIQGLNDIEFYIVKSPGELISMAYDRFNGFDTYKQLNFIGGIDRINFLVGLATSIENKKIPELRGHIDKVTIDTPNNQRLHNLSGTAMRTSINNDNFIDFLQHLGEMFTGKEAAAIYNRIKIALKNNTIKIKRT